MTQKPHPQRCETCKIPKNQTFPKWCPVIEAWVGKNFPREVGWVIDKVGCASHSSAASGREQVLETFYDRILDESFSSNRGVIVIELKRISELYDELKAELRKQGEQR